MSKNLNQNKNHKLELINSALLPKWYNCIYSSDKNTLIYTLSSNIIIYNLSDDSKKIISDKDKSAISNIKYLDKEKNIFIKINKRQYPVLSIFSLDGSKEYIYSKIIPVEEGFNISNIFIDRFRYNLFFILLSGINRNILYFFHLTNITNISNNKYSLIPIGKLQKLDLEVTDFKCFYNDDLLICTTRNSIIYYKINLQNQTCSLYKNIPCHFSIKSRTLKIDRKNGFISFLSLKGECLIYDKEGNFINNIKCPLNNNEYFNFNIFSDFNDSLCLVTNKGNILLYDIEYQSHEEYYNFKVKKFIKYSYILQLIKERYQYNKNIDNDDNIKESKNNIEVIYYNEKDYLIMIINNSLISLSLSNILNKNFTKNNLILYNFNHNQKINRGIIIYKSGNPSQNNSYDNIIYTCSNDNILSAHYYNYSKNRFINHNINFNYILKNKDIYITAIRFHPKYPKDILYLGDSKGYLYIIYKSKNFNYQKYNLNDINTDTYNEASITSIIFSQSSEYIIYIGFDNGLQKLYDLKADKNFNYYKLLSNEYMDKNEIQYRKSKSHIINFCYFFIYKYNLKECFAYLAGKKLVKISKFENENNLYISNSYNNDVLSIKYHEPILDIIIHKSENYILVLNNKRQIIIKEINYGNIVSILNFNNIINYIYNFQLDISGLYLSLICDFKSNNKNKIYDINTNKSSIAIIELTTGKIKNYVNEMNYIISKTKFDYYGRFLISLGEKGEISIWKLNKEINNNIIKAIEKLKDNFYAFWDKFNIRKNQKIEIDNNGEILDEMMTDELINKEKYILDIDNYVNQEDFFRINNKGENDIENYNKSKSASLLIRDDSNINLTNNISSTFIPDEISKSNHNINNNMNDCLLEQDHYINRNIYNYKNSTNYANNIRNKYKKNFETEIEKSYSSKRRRISSISTENNIIKNIKQKRNEILSSEKAESLRDIIMKNNKSRNKENKETENDLKHIETPQFNVIQTHPVDKADLNLFSLSSNKNEKIFLDVENNKDDKDIIELKKKIIEQSSSLLYNQRRMLNLNNAMNKIKSNQNIINIKSVSNKEGIKNNQINKYDRYIKLFDSNFEEKEKREKNKFKINKKYPEPDDIDNNLINIDINLFKNDRNLKKIDDKDDISNENMFYINNRSTSNLLNNYNEDKSNSISLIKENQNNNIINNSIFGKSNSIINNNNYNIHDLTNNNVSSVGDQISYLENNIKKFEKTFGK